MRMEAQSTQYVLNNTCQHQSAKEGTESTLQMSIFSRHRLLVSRILGLIGKPELETRFPMKLISLG